MYSTWNKLSLAGILSHEEEVSRGESVESVESERDYEVGKKLEYRFRRRSQRSLPLSDEMPTRYDSHLRFSVLLESRGK